MFHVMSQKSCNTVRDCPSYMIIPLISLPIWKELGKIEAMEVSSMLEKENMGIYQSPFKTKKFYIVDLRRERIGEVTDGWCL